MNDFSVAASTGLWQNVISARNHINVMLRAKAKIPIQRGDNHDYSTWQW